MSKTFFWDVDTQHDFVKKDGKLYVPGAEEIIPHLALLTFYARHHGIRVLGSVDWHRPSDPEISAKPDFKETFPEHCVEGSSGSKKIPETAPENPLWIEPERYLWKELERRVRTHPGEIFFRKNRFDVFSNPNVDLVLDILEPGEMVVYGVALDVCNAYAIQGFLKKGKFKISLVEDASKPILEKRGRELLAEWRAKGVRILKTADVEKGII